MMNLKKLLRLCYEKIYIFHNLFIKTKYYKKRDFYSHSGEDLFIIQNCKKKGFYIDVGCHHPTKLNNCHLLYLNGWRGINIDINKISIDLFNSVRKKDINICKAVSLKKGKVKFFYDKKLSLYNSLINKSDLKYSDEIISSPLSDIIDETSFKDHQIDFLSVDAEGKDLEVLQSLDFQRYKPKFICVEIWGDSKNENFKLENNEIYNFLIKKKYKMVFNRMENYIFHNKYSNI